MKGVDGGEDIETFVDNLNPRIQLSIAGVFGLSIGFRETFLLLVTLLDMRRAPGPDCSCKSENLRGKGVLLFGA